MNVFNSKKIKLEQDTLSILKFLNENLITEVSKKKILIDKVGLTPHNAELLERVAGPLSVFIANKIIQRGLQYFSTKESAIKSVNTNFVGFIRLITGIMDWVRVGLNGNLGDNKDLNFDELVNKSIKWHEELGVKSGEINYVENNPILIDFRNKDGEGFYWADLKTNTSDEECKRMGHCGRTGYGNILYSLRETKKIPGGKYTINKSHLTASIGNGTLYQLKGQKNSKPQEKYYPYILPLFDISNDMGEFLIDSFGHEYDSSRDFSFTDLDSETIKKIYEKRPELFEKRKLQKLLQKLNIIEKPETQNKIIVKIKPEQLGNVIKGDYVVRTRKYKTPAGNERSEKIYLFETILSGEHYDLYDNYHYADWEGAVDYELDEKNKSKIEEYLKQIVKNEIEDYEKVFEDNSLVELIEDFDKDGEIVNAIKNAINLAESNDYADYLHDTLRTACEELGRVIKLDDEGLEVEVNIEKILDDLGDDEYEDLMDRCDDDLECVWFEYMDQYGDRPEFDLRDYYPDMDSSTFNSYLEDNLNEI